MLDMGFEPEIKKILLDIRPDRQTIMTRQVKSICFSRASFLKQIQCMWVVALVRDRVTEAQIIPDKDKLLLLWFMSAVKGCIIQSSMH